MTIRGAAVRRAARGSAFHPISLHSAILEAPVATTSLSDTFTKLPPARGGPVRILVVDDVPANILVLSKMVKVLGHTTFSAEHGAQAIEKAKAEKPDLILMDVMMPVMDGIEATKRLKADPETRLIPIVIVTALNDAKGRQTAADAGADDFLGKPVDSLELQIRLRALLAVKRTYDELEAARHRASEADRLKTDFLSSISHELRTPLTAIASAAKILMKHGVEKPESVQKFAPVIAEQAARMTRLLDEVLDLAKIEAGQVTWRDETFLPSQAAESVSEMFHAQAEERGINLAVQLRPAGPGEGYVYGDRDRIMQVLVNLTSNALKFTPKGGSIRIAAARIGPAEAPAWGITPKEGRGAVLLAVEDTGAGIAPENHELVFEKFRQVVDETSGKPHGTGLGLSICKDIVERHGGRLGLRSAIGKGSRFTVALPEVAAP